MTDAGFGGELPDYGDPISFKVLRRGTPVITSDGVTIGKTLRAAEAAREHIFDGINIDTDDGRRFLDAPEVARIYERAVVTTFTADESAAHLQIRKSLISELAASTTTSRRLKRWQSRARDAWDRR